MAVLKKGGVATVFCNCKHQFQDKQYGASIRLVNIKDKIPLQGTCTVCGRTHFLKESQIRH
jgi:hypothetical protein